MESTAVRASHRYARASRRIDLLASPFDLSFEIRIGHAAEHNEIDRTTEERGQFIAKRKEGSSGMSSAW
jgi:hypothetical protein